MAESFVNTFKRDYVARMDLWDAKTVLAQLPSAFEHFNEVRPRGTIGLIPPAEFAAKHRKPNPSTTDAGSVNLQTLGPLSN